MTAERAPLSSVPTLEDDVHAWLDLTERIEALTAERDVVKKRLRDAGEGKHETSFGVTVTITPPPRSFNAERAWTMLTPDQQALCVSPDSKKVKAQLSQTLVDMCMDPGTGEPRVAVK